MNNVKAFKIAVKNLKKARDLSKETLNDFNRTKTLFKQDFAEFLKTNGRKPGDMVSYNDLDLVIAKNNAKVISSKKWYKLFKKGKITEQQFLECISVIKSRASLSAGEDVVLAIEKTIAGNKADLRIINRDETVKGVKFKSLDKNTTPKRKDKTTSARRKIKIRASS